jgi:hypothetical protein
MLEYSESLLNQSQHLEMSGPTFNYFSSYAFLFYPITSHTCKLLTIMYLRQKMEKCYVVCFGYFSPGSTLLIHLEMRETRERERLLKDIIQGTLCIALMEPREHSLA